MKRRLATVLILAWAASGTPARAAETALSSTPPGLRVSLSGPVSLSGSAPLPVDDLPAGRYVLLLSGAGYPIARGSFHREPGEAWRLSSYAGPGALLTPPGLTHLARGERTRGMILLGAGLASAGVAIVQQVQLDDAADDVRRAQRRYDDASGDTAVREARAALESAHDRADRAREVRSLWTAFAGAVWVGAAAEAWILTPAPDLARNGDMWNVSTARRSGAAAALRSALVPGGGQRYAGRNGAAGRFAVGVTVAAAGALLAHESYLDKRSELDEAQRRYDAATTEGEATRWRDRVEDVKDAADGRNRLRWVVAGAAGAIYVWNVIDAALSAGPAGEARAWSLRLRPEGDGFAAGFTWRIEE